MDWTSKSNKIEFSITTYCNAKCPLCAHTHMTNDKTLVLQHADFKVFKNFVKNLNEGREVVLCGDYGDPMMHPNIQDYIDCSMENNLKLTIHTNGGLRTTKFYEYNSKYANLCIVFGIDGMSQKVNQKYRVNVDFKKALNNMLTFKRSGGHAQWDYLIFDYNIDDLYSAIELCKKEGIKIKPALNNREWEFKVTDVNQRSEIVELLKQHKHGKHIERLAKLEKYQL